MLVCLQNSRINTIFARKFPIMKLEEKKIISFHGNIALWCAMNRQDFNDFFQNDSSPKCGIDYACRQFYLNEIDELIDASDDLEKCDPDYFKATLSDYYDFCKNRLVEMSYFSNNVGNKAQKESEEWLDFFETNVIDKYVLSSLFQKQDPLVIINRWNKTITRDMVLSYCDESKKQKILLNALVSLLFNAILKGCELVRQVKCCKLLRDSLIDKKENRYSASSYLCSAFKHLKSNICESFFKGFEMNIADYDSLLSYIDMEKDDSAIKEIANLRNKGHLVNDSLLIEFCADFKHARAQDRYIDWNRRFRFTNEIQSINAFILKRIQEEQLFSQDIINSLLNSIIPGFDFDAVKRPQKVKKDVKVEKRYISHSMRHVDKEKFIDMLIKKEWVAIDCERKEVESRLNYFFNDDSSDLPRDPQFTIAWNKTPKNQLVCLLIRMLLTKTWDFEAEKVVIRQVDEIDEENGKRLYPGINSAVIDHINTGETVWKTVNAVFRLSNAANGTFNSTRYRKNLEKNLDKLVELANDLLSCKKDSSKVSYFMK